MQQNIGNKFYPYGSKNEDMDLKLCSILKAEHLKTSKSHSIVMAS